jgi:hypothetical protein
MKKFHQSAIKLIRELGCTIIEQNGHRGHLHFTIRLPSGETHLLNCSGTPTNHTGALFSIRREIKGLL